MENFKFDPVNGLLDSGVFNEPANETETRTQMQTLHNQTRDYINSMLSRYGANAIIFRINANKNLEFSVDGEYFEEIVARGERGPAGPGVPSGGEIGQVVVKKSLNEYDTEWKDLAGKSNNSSIKIDGTLKVNQLSIPTLDVIDAEVKTLETAEWWDSEQEYMKYIDVVVEDCVETAKPDHIVMTTSFSNLCKSWKALDGKIRFILSNDAGATISTTLKEIIIQYQD